MSFSHLLTHAALEQTVGHAWQVAAPTADSGTITPEALLRFLAGLRMLKDVPFNTLVPDSRLLPNESIRFFFLDRAWTDALVQGALSVATANSVERAQLEALYPRVEAEIDDAERKYRAPGGEALSHGTAGLVSGFLLRSAAVAGWPGLHVRAYATEPGGNDTDVLPENHASRIKLLRLERLAPAVLLALFDGLPQVVHIEEPRQGVQFGVKLDRDRRGRGIARVPARNVQTAGYVNSAGNPVTLPHQAAQIPVSFRPGVAGVLNLGAIARAFKAANGTAMTDPPNPEVDSAEFAMQMLRFPARQIYAQRQSGTLVQNDAFRPTVVNLARSHTEMLAQRIAED